MGNKYQVF